MGRKRSVQNQYQKTYTKEPLRTYKEIVKLSWKGVFRYVMQEVGMGRTYEDIGKELGMTRANVSAIVQKAKKRAIHI
jgi:predicted transcriptional regulator